MRISDWSSDVCSSDLCETVGITYHRPLLAAPDIAARCFGLPIGQPALRNIALGNALGPEDQYIDPGIAPCRSGILRHGAAACRAVPRLHPRQPPIFRSEERSVGQEWVSTCRSRWSP